MRIIHIEGSYRHHSNTLRLAFYEFREEDVSTRLNRVIGCSDTTTHVNHYNIITVDTEDTLPDHKGKNVNIELGAQKKIFKETQNVLCRL